MEVIKAFLFVIFILPINFLESSTPICKEIKNLEVNDFFESDQGKVSYKCDKSSTMFNEVSGINKENRIIQTLKNVNMNNEKQSLIGHSEVDYIKVNRLVISNSDVYLKVMFKNLSSDQIESNSSSEALPIEITFLPDPEHLKLIIFKGCNLTLELRDAVKDHDRNYRIKSIIIENSVFDDFYFSLLLTTSTEILKIVKTNIDDEMLPGNIFAKAPNLKIVSLAENKFAKFSRSWFAKEMKYLWSLDLSGNNIQYLDDDSFVRMPNLRKIRLDNNDLVTISSQLFNNPIWDNLIELTVEGKHF